MSYKSLFENAFLEVLDKIEVGQTLGISHNGQADTARVYAYQLRTIHQRPDIKFKVTPTQILCTRSKVDMEVGDAVRPNARLKIDRSAPAESFVGTASNAVPPVMPAVGQLITDKEPTEEILEHLHHLMESGVVQIAEFIGETEAHFTSLPNHDKFHGNKTKRGYAVV